MPTKIDAAKQLQWIVPVENLPEWLPIDWDNVLNKPESFPPSSHNHDDRYYTETEIDSIITWLDKSSVWLSNVDNTSDLNKPVSNSVQIELDKKQNTLVAWTNITIDNTNPDAPVISATWWGWTYKFCQANLWSNQTVVSWTSATMAFTSFTTNDSWMSVTNNRVTITETWAYVITWAITFSANATWVREIILRLNWSTIIWDITWLTNTSWWAFTTCTITYIWLLSAWNYLELRWYQTSWWDLVVQSGWDKTYLHVWKL